MNSEYINRYASVYQTISWVMTLRKTPSETPCLLKAVDSSQMVLRQIHRHKLEKLFGVAFVKGETEFWNSSLPVFKPFYITKTFTSLLYKANVCEWT
jgi:hypothetical protein